MTDVSSMEGRQCLRCGTERILGGRCPFCGWSPCPECDSLGGDGRACPTCGRIRPYSIERTSVRLIRASGRLRGGERLRALLRARAWWAREMLRDGVITRAQAARWMRVPLADVEAERERERAARRVRRLCRG